MLMIIDEDVKDSQDPHTSTESHILVWVGPPQIAALAGSTFDESFSFMKDLCRRLKSVWTSGTQDDLQWSEGLGPTLVMTCDNPVLRLDQKWPPVLDLVPTCPTARPGSHLIPVSQLDTWSPFLSCFIWLFPRHL